MGQPQFGWLILKPAFIYGATTVCMIFLKTWVYLWEKTYQTQPQLGIVFPTPDRPLLHHWTTPPPDQRAAKEWNRCSKDFMEPGGESNGPKVWPSKKPRSLVTHSFQKATWVLKTRGVNKGYIYIVYDIYLLIQPDVVFFLNKLVPQKIMLETMYGIRVILWREQIRELTSLQISVLDF